MKARFYLRNIGRRWKNEVRKATTTTVLSPYITSHMAENVLAKNDCCCIKIYTVFKAENFINQASSIYSLRKLLSAGCELFHLDNLHAKLVVTNEFVSLGSQNLTNRGARNLEASYCSMDLAEISHIKHKLNDWLIKAVPINWEMLDEMEAMIKPLIKSYKNVIVHAQKVDESIDVIVEANKESEKQIKRAIERKVNLKEKINKLPIKSNWERASIKCIKNTNHSGETKTSSLVGSVNLMQWSIDGQLISLKKTFRYILIDTETGKLAWARVNKTRITYFGKSVKIAEDEVYFNYQCALNFEAEWNNPVDEFNLKINIESIDRRNSIGLSCYFDTDSIQNLEITDRDCADTEFLSRFEEVVDNQDPKFTDYLLKRLLSPFTYSKNSFGVQANDFFKSGITDKKISLATIAGHPLIVVEDI